MIKANPSLKPRLDGVIDMYAVRVYIPIESMYGIFNYIHNRFKPKVGRYTLHGWYGYIMKYITHQMCPLKFPLKGVGGILLCHVNLQERSGLYMASY